MEENNGPHHQQDCATRRDAIMPGIQQEQCMATHKKANNKQDPTRQGKETLWKDFWSIPLKDRLVIEATFLLLLAGIVTAWAIIKQARIMDDTLTEIKTGGEQTERLAITSRGQLAVVSKTSQLENRSWIGLTTFNIGSLPPGQNTFGPIIPNVPISGNFVIENFGKTPAEIDGIGMKLEVRKSPVPENFDYGAEGRKKGLTIFPSQQRQTTNADSITIPEPEFIAIENNPFREWGKESLVLHGTIRYHDAFGSHMTKICLFWTGHERDFNNCTEYNKAD